VFARVGELLPGDRIEVTGDNLLFTYDVVWSRLYEEATAPVAEIAGPTEDESLTLITCGGEWDAAAQRYAHRLVVRAARSEG
jgi:sortase (surface protein transpeptidase)